ncbi:MAG: hypothetical protein AB8G86_13175 [Saprospiraceae bacterium]
MKKVSKFVAIIFSLLSFPLLGQHVGKITIDQQVNFTQFSAVGNPNLLVESIALEITLADMAQLNEESMKQLITAHTNNNRTNRLVSFQEKNIALPLFKGELFPLKRLSHTEDLVHTTTSTLLLVEKSPKKVLVVPTNLSTPATQINRPKALGSLLKF